MNFIQKLCELTQAESLRYEFFEESALTLEIVHAVDSPEYSVYMGVPREIDFRIKDEFEKRGIEMTYPTQTVYLAGGKNG